jgi:hypothetical protein
MKESKKTKFTQQQPKDGDTVLHCGHISCGHFHWFRTRGMDFESPDGEKGWAEWVAVCNDCFLENPKIMSDGEFPIRGHGTWMGDDPEIRVSFMQPEQFMDQPNADNN